jgi:DNA modification methylase
MTVRILIGDVRDRLKDLPDGSVNCIVTSPPYFGLRDYGVAGQIGLEPTPDEFVATMVAVFREARRVLRDDGTLWLNLGDSYAANGVKATGRNDAGRNFTGGGGNNPGSGNPGRMGSIRVDHGLKPKDLIGIPWRVAFALQADGWYLRSSIIWHKPNPMPESVTDRPTSAHENIFLFAKSQRYFYDAEAVKEESSTFGRQNTNGLSPKMLEKQALGHVSAKTGMVDPYAYEKRNLRNVWTIPTEPFPGSHFAVFPPALIEPCIKAGCPVGGTVLDPFGGAGTTGLVADRLGRNALLIELNPEYAEMARRRIEGDAGMFAGVGLEAAE